MTDLQRRYRRFLKDGVYGSGSSSRFDSADTTSDNLSRCWIRSARQKWMLGGQQVCDKLAQLCTWTMPPQLTIMGGRVEERAKHKISNSSDPVNFMKKLTIVAEHSRPYLFFPLIYLVGATGAVSTMCAHARAAGVALGATNQVSLWTSSYDFNRMNYCVNPNWQHKGVNSLNTQHTFFLP